MQLVVVSSDGDGSAAFETGLTAQEGCVMAQLAHPRSTPFPDALTVIPCITQQPLTVVRRSDGTFTNTQPPTQTPPGRSASPGGPKCEDSHTKTGFFAFLAVFLNSGFYMIV